MSNLQQFNRTIQRTEVQDYLTQVLSAKKDAYVNNIVALVGNSKNLQECDPMTIIYAGIKATALGLPLDSNIGCAYVIPYKDNRNRTTVAQFQLGYKGFIQLAIRSGQFKTLNVTEVKEGELGDFDLLTGTMKFQAVANRHEKPTIGYVAFFSLINGFEKTLYMTKEEIEQHAGKYSQTYKYKGGVWQENFDVMAKKTVLKLLLSKYAPLSVEMQTAITSDQAVFKEADKPSYVDNEVEEAQAEELPSDEQIAEAIASIEEAGDLITLTATYNELPNELKADRSVMQAMGKRKSDLEDEAEADAAASK